MRNFWCVATIALAACGGLDEGTYDVTASLTDNDCPFDVNEDFTAEWEMKDKGDGRWTLSEDGGDPVSGEEEDGSLVFSEAASEYDADLECTITQSITVEIEPDGDRFSGEMRFVSDVDCVDGSTDTCRASWDVEGEKK